MNKFIGLLAVLFIALITACVARPKEGVATVDNTFDASFHMTSSFLKEFARSLAAIIVYCGFTQLMGHKVLFSDVASMVAVSFLSLYLHTGLIRMLAPYKFYRKQVSVLLGCVTGANIAFAILSFALVNCLRFTGAPMWLFRCVAYTFLCMALMSGEVFYRRMRSQHR